MIPDPTTEEGRKELKRRLDRIKKMDKGNVERAIANADDEPNGKLSAPNELDLRRNLKHDD